MFTVIAVGNAPFKNSHPFLTGRYRQILRATVRSYIDTAEPVGSKMLTQQYNFGLSPATIRNAMSALESWGLLFQPHTSAGRIPSDSGYRVYVDELLAPPTELVQQMRLALQENLANRQELEHLLHSATRLLATLSGCVAMITAPQSASVTVRHLQIVNLGEGRAMVIVITDALQTRSFLLDLPHPEMAEELEILNNYLNIQLQSRHLSEIKPEEGSDQFHWYAEFLNKLVALLQQVLQPPIAQLYVSGVGEILRQPEFAEPERIQAIVQLLEDERERIGPLMNSQNPMGRIVVRIGAENPLEPMQFCSMVFGNYYRNDVPIGSIGVLGPTRLPYERAIASVEAATQHLSHVMRVEE
ncbi:MAG: heat-inducible transcriptional repressor HrcA [Anaerolineae bacterium]|nr:heat-inducible transcriptional repressor HrcA [Gloeobacterales cyanobacterium ES-bin-313]